MEFYLDEYKLKKSKNLKNEFPYISFDHVLNHLKFTVHQATSFLDDCHSGIYHLSKYDDLVWNNIKIVKGISYIFVSGFEYNEEIFIFTLMALENDKANMKIRISKVDQENLKVVLVKDIEKILKI